MLMNTISKSHSLKQHFGLLTRTLSLLISSLYLNAAPIPTGLLKHPLLSFSLNRSS